MNAPASVCLCAALALATASSILVTGCAHASKTASVAEEQKKIVLPDEEFEWVSVTGSALRVRRPKNKAIQTADNTTNAVSTLNVQQFGAIQNKTNQIVNKR